MSAHEKCPFLHHNLLDTSVSLPKKVIHHIEGLCRNLLWNGKEERSYKAPVAWEKLCKPKNSGGLNIIELLHWNIATLEKLLWKIQSKADKLWVRWLN